ncbi:LbtU family siderophore porin [bacterium]|nr:LbtU family siderophore porin [bacterium]MCI0603171.1 LbtU family siderophore porin [bacterium]
MSYWFVAILATLLAVGPVFGQEEVSTGEEEEEARSYRTREERRSAGLKFKITDGVVLTGLFESEYIYEGFRLRDESRAQEDEFSAPLQLGLEMVPSSWAKVELIYEYDIAGNEHILDEAVLIMKAGDFDVELGKLYVPFGEYFSHFVTGPMLEFGETRDAGVVLSYTPNARLDLSTFVYKGRAVQEESGGSSLDWGFSAECSPFDFGTFAISYLSDLADSQERFLNDSNHRYENRVGALSGYGLVGYGPFEVTAEFVYALSSFEELDSGQNRPRAWNLELAYYPKNELELALRYERSNEFKDEPRFKTGIGATWHAAKNIYLSLEYLHGKFNGEFSEDSEEPSPRTLHQFAARISIL